MPYLPDLARLEWKVNLVLHAADAEALEVLMEEAAIAEAILEEHANEVAYANADANAD